jgi:hypothetical protein
MGGEVGKVTVSQAEFARLRGVSRKTVTIWKGQGRLAFTTEGLVDVSASDELLTQRPPVYRGGKAKPRKGEQAAAAPLPDSAPVMDRAPGETAGWSLAEAQRVTARYLAGLYRLRYERESAEIAPVEVITLEIEREYAIVRERLRSIPNNICAALAGCETAALDAVDKADAHG